jgi:hypothetical protein
MTTQLARLFSWMQRRRSSDRELEEFRSLMRPPGSFDDGFSWSSFLGALFVAALMVPGSIYMTLIAGMSVGPAAQWVTVILFIEVARRANKQLRRAEIFTLFYLAGAIMVTASMAQGSFQGGLGVLWSQFFAQSDAARAAGIAEHLPRWVVPSEPAILEKRSLFQWQWLPAVGLVVFTMIVGRLDNMVLGYGLFRLTSDIEKLPFPMAPVGAQGIMALSEEQDEDLALRRGQAEDKDQSERSWRWRVFSVGSVMGIVFGMLYIGVPTITGALLDRPITILPLPFKDFTPLTGRFLPATAIAVAVDLGMVLLGMVLPYWAMVGTFCGLLLTFVVNPILSRPTIGVLRSWSPGDSMQVTFYKNQIDFYFSFAIGIGLAIAVAGIGSAARGLVRARRRRRRANEEPAAMAPAIPQSRGDIRPGFILLTYGMVVSLYLSVSTWLLYVADGKIYWPVVVVMAFYALLYTPITSYVTVRLEGIAGEVLNIPFVREAAFIFSGYRGVAVWFLPIPLHNYSQMVVQYRQAELTGTSFWSIWKSELLLTPIIVIGSLLFAHLIWGLGPIPSPQFLFAQQWWEVTAAQQSIVFSSTLGGFTEFEEAFRGSYILLGLGLGILLLGGFTWLGAPTFFVYGIVRGLNQTLPFVVIPQFVGALVGRFYFRRRMGLRWRQYIPIVFAGFSCGMGLVATLCIGLTFVTKSVFALPY